MISYTCEEHIFCGDFHSSEHFFLLICGEGGRQGGKKNPPPYPGAILAPLPFPASSRPGYLKLPLNLMSFFYCIFVLSLTSRPLPPSFDFRFPPSLLPFSVSPSLSYSPGFPPPFPSPLIWWCRPCLHFREIKVAYETYALMPRLF